MSIIKKSALVAFALLAALLVLSAAQAQDAGPVVRSTFYLAPDADGVQQVYTLLLDGQSEARQVTRAESDVLTFGAAYDSLSTAYISGSQLWLQPIHTEEAEALADVGAEQFFSGPVYSPDGQYIAYADRGVWLLDLATRQTRLILMDVPVNPSADNAGDFRVHQPEGFVLGNDGKAEKLVVDVGVWEWNTVGVYDLATGVMDLLQGQLHSGLLPLSDGRALLYGNGGVAGEFALHIAESLEDINTYTRLVQFADLTRGTLFADQAVEIRPGVVRVSGQAFVADQPDVNAFYFDYDLMQGTASAVQWLALPVSTSGATTVGALSPDGALLPVYRNAVWSDAGSISGVFSLRDLATGGEVAAALPETVGLFRWGP